MKKIDPLMIKLSIVIPCYNEGENIIPLFNKINNLLEKSSNIEIIIINNGSTDDSKKIILNSDLYINKKIKFFEIKDNIGYGHGIMMGVKIANGENIGWCHADLQTEPEDVLNAYLKNSEKLKNEQVIVKGIRKNRNLFDVIFTFGMSIISSIIFQRIINDINAQPKLFPKYFRNFLTDYPNDFSLDLYLLIIAKINNYKIINHNVFFKKRLHGEAKGGGSINVKMKLIRRTLLYMFKLRKKIWKL
jgi:glycosyltransferase involved in cell wall biosynthesis